MRFVSTVCRSLCSVYVVVCEACQLLVSIMADVMLRATCTNNQRETFHFHIVPTTLLWQRSGRLAGGVSRIVWLWRWHRHVNTEHELFHPTPNWLKANSNAIPTIRCRHTIAKSVAREYVKWQEARVHRSWHRAFCHDGGTARKFLRRTHDEISPWNFNGISRGFLSEPKHSKIIPILVFTCVQCVRTNRMHYFVNLLIPSNVLVDSLINWTFLVYIIHCFHVMSVRPCINFEIVFTCRVFCWFIFDCLLPPTSALFLQFIDSNMRETTIIHWRKEPAKKMWTKSNPIVRDPNCKGQSDCLASRELEVETKRKAFRGIRIQYGHGQIQRIDTLQYSLRSDHCGETKTKDSNKTALQLTDGANRFRLQRNMSERKYRMDTSLLP